jgi:hypothetical protein
MTPSLIVEDVLLLLFQPSSGTIAGEGTLFYVLGGAVLTDLALDERIELDDGSGLTGRRVRAVGSVPPADPLLAQVWHRIAEKPRSAQTLLAEVGPSLRGTVLDRLVEHGHLRREKRKMLGLFTTTALADGGTSRRAEVLQQVRAVLVDGVPPDPRTAALGALLSASGSLPSFDPGIPWSTPVIKRAKALERGDWGADAVEAAVARTVAATAVGALVAIGVIAPD